MQILEPMGALFLNAIKMMIVPVVFCSIVNGVINIADPKYLGRIGLKAMSIYVSTMALATIVGLVIASLLHPGKQNLSNALQNIDTTTTAATTMSIRDVVVSLIPSNPLAAFVEVNVVQIVVFAFIFGIAIISAGKRGQAVVELFNSLAEVVGRLPCLIMKFAPYGVYALMSSRISTFGVEVLQGLFLTVIAIYLGCILFAAIFYSAALRFYGLNPKHFFDGMREAMAFAFSTTSSAATLPYTSQCTKKNLGVSNRVADFVLPLGATINMNGLALYLGVATIFAANFFNVQLGFWDYVSVTIMGVVASIGAAGVPGAALVVMSLVMSSIGFQADAIALIIGLIASVDRIIDMMTTTINITGDAFASVIIAKSEGELDIERYNAPTEPRQHPRKVSITATGCTAVVATAAKVMATPVPKFSEQKE
jgi:Na+/H+-dicarboxylate symporter